MQKFFLRLFRLCFKLWPLKKGKGRLQTFGLKLLQGLTVKAECYNNTKFLLSFPRDNGWEYPDNEIIREYIYDFIVNDPVYLCGNLSNEEYVIMRNYENVGIFKQNKYIKKDECPCLCV